MRLLVLAIVGSSSVSAFAAADLQVKFTHGGETTMLDVVEIFPHDPDAFTQGFEIHNDIFWESTGMYGKSSMRTIDMESGKPAQSLPLDQEYFGEGMTTWGDSVYQLTWHKGKTFIYDRETLKQTGDFSYSGEGWGLTHDDEDFVMSDGSDKLFFRDRKTFDEKRKVTVREISNGSERTIRNLNELEMVSGFVFANIWFDTRIAIIDPESGVVVAWIDCASLKNNEPRTSDVLNGIAYDEASGRLFVTGKYWSSVYELTMPDIDVLRQ